MNKILQISTVALAVFLALICCASAQQPQEVALIRGHFSGGNDLWLAQDFGWFYYDLDKGTGGETLSIDLDARKAEKGHIVIKSQVWSEDFECEPWGFYQAVAFLGKRYLAGYPKSNFTEKVSSIEKGYLREVLIDDDQVHTLNYNSSLALLDGYVLALNGISESNDVVNFVLLKNKNPVDYAVVSVGDTYVFKVEDIPVIMVHVSKAFRSQDSGVAEVDGVFQVSDIPIFMLTVGDKLDNMEVTEVSEEGLELKNNRSLNLLRDSTVHLIDGLIITVVDNENLIYYPVGLITEYGYHEIRGPVVSADSSTSAVLGRYPVTAEAKWDPASFGGFYFNPSNMIGTETLLVFDTEDRSIPPIVSNVVNDTLLVKGLQYISYAQKQDFEYKPWGSFKVISLYGQLWFAGYSPETSSAIKRQDLLGQDYLSQILIDTDEPRRAVAGSMFGLAEDYDFIVIDVGNESIFIQLLKEGRVVDSSVIKSNETYVYKTTVAGIEDVPIIALHVQNIFNDDSRKLAIIDGIFQISERTIPVEESLDLGETAIMVSNPEIMVIGNPERIKLNRDSTVNLWPGASLRVADNDTLRYYIYSVEYVVPRPRLVQEVNYPENVPSSGSANFTMVAKAAEIVQVDAEILDPASRTIYLGDLTRSGRGSEDIWIYSWTWNASLLEMSDDGSAILDADPVLALLYLDEATPPVQVEVKFDRSGRIYSITGGRSIYYISPAGYSQANTTLSYEEMLANETTRKTLIKIQPESSLLRFLEIKNGTTTLSDINHTITGNLESLEPHVVRKPAPLGPYELRVRIQNISPEAFKASGIFFNVTEPEAGSTSSEPLNSIDISAAPQDESAKQSNAPAILATILALALAFLMRREG